jgi:4-aminobutyrate aminotransferase/(S)-3-amino-2-methylpropionate transaminase
MDAPGVGGIGGTFGGNPLACAAALAVLDIIEHEGLAARALAIGETVMERFAALQRRFAFVGDIRGLGAMCGLEIVDPETGRPDAPMASRITGEALKHGLLIMTASGNVLRTLMPLVISDEELRRGLDALERAMSEV